MLLVLSQKRILYKFIAILYLFFNLLLHFGRKSYAFVSKYFSLVLPTGHFFTMQDGWYPLTVMSIRLFVKSVR